MGEAMNRQPWNAQPERWRMTDGQRERFCGCGEWKPFTTEFFTFNSSYGESALSTRCRALHSAKNKARYAVKTGKAPTKSVVVVAETTWAFPGVDNATIHFIHSTTAKWPTHVEGIGFYGR